MIASRTPTGRITAGFAATVVAAGLLATAAGTAYAAVPDKWGFAFIDKPTVPGIPALTHQAGSWPAPLHVHSAPGVLGQVIVRFPDLASQGGVVHVTAVDSSAVWCEAQKWMPSGTSELVFVRCFKASPVTPVFAQFTVVYTKSTTGPFPAGAAYGYVHYRPGSGIVARFNSAGGANTVTPGAVGVWVVRMPGLGSAVQAGGVQVTAVDPSGPAKCELRAWSWSPGGQRFLVSCFDGGVTPLKTGWTLSYQRRRSITGGGKPTLPKRYAYTLNNQPTIAGPYAPVPASVNYNSAGAVNTILKAGTGLSLVQFPHVGVLPNTVLVTGFDVGPGFCNLLTIWATSSSAPNVTVRDVACYTAAGVLKDQESLITYTSSH